ncbi:MAG: winged helix-turn-helix transcriptional regulator [Bacteroidaceae bacterium]|nr:winged helix-turn-helix transcriptional regulator [Bacteroidaceae bacterium]
MDIIYELIKKNPKITRAELVKETGKASSYIQRCIETLKRDNLIRRAGADYVGHWEIIDNEKP